MNHVHTSLFLDGAWRKPLGSGSLPVVCASTEDVIGSVPEASPADVDVAVAAARRAFDDPSGWSRWQPEARAAVLSRLAEVLEGHGSTTAELVGMQNGMPLHVGLTSEAVVPAGLLRYYAYLAAAVPVEEERPSLAGGRPTIVRREAVGVIAAVVPWNYPQSLTFFKLAPALAAGCTVVLKPSPETVLDAFLLADAVLEAGLPPGVLSIVPGGRELGAYLVAHPGVDKVAFTGSTAAGRVIAATCGELLRPVTLELGGKSAAIVLDDADLDQLASGLFAATLQNNGQTCYLGTRILAPRARYREVVELVAAMASSLVVGDALDPATRIGPLATSRQRTRVEGYVSAGVASGAKLVTGGGRPAELSRGWFVEPTVFSDVDNRSALAQEEIFGPVLCVIPFDSDDEAVTLANDSDFGLGGSVWTSDEGRGLEVARRIHTGTIGLNGYALDVGAPFGGVKASGLGRELGPEGLLAYQTLKSIYRT